jgi:cytoplasmic iron level regulating protein YaaA (DUF328/UPF0246 family)
MLILLPPSEGKSAPEAGPALDLSMLAFPELRDTREEVLGALTRLCSGPTVKAAKTLGLGPTQHGEVGANTRLSNEPCGPAIKVYTGVLYEALDAGSLSAAARRRLDSTVAISSGLWGLVRPSDLIPSYRLSGGVTLPGVGKLSTVWRETVSNVISQQDGLVIDMRSGAYVALGPLSSDLSDRAVTVRVLTERMGKRTVVSHHNKSTKGLVARTLVQSRRTPRSVSDLTDLLATAGHHVELTPQDKAGVPYLDVVLYE